MTKLRVLDLFAGIGGFSLGLERTGGFETVAFCEIEPFCQKVLAKHWPGVPIYDDITSADFGSVGPVDMVTAGFPCQDISLAGKGTGLAGERSGLFWHILRTVRMVGRPKLLLENVAALLGRGMGSVLGAMASIGYDAEWHCIPASALGGAHIRDRLWICANPNSDGHEGLRIEQCFSEAADKGLQQSEFQIGKTDNHVLCRDFRGAHASGVFGMADGVSDRTHRLRSVGNSIVPQIPEMLGRAILEAA